MQNKVRESDKLQAIVVLNGSRGTDPCQQMVALAQIFIDETREYNDTAQGNEIFLNQGRIDAFKQMISAITVGIPTH